MSTVIVFDAAGGRKGGKGARQVGLEVVVMEYKLGLPVFWRYEKKYRRPFLQGRHDGILDDHPIGLNGF